MKSFVDKNNKPVDPSFVKLGAYKKMLDAHKALQIGSTKSKDGRGQMEREVRYTDIRDVKCNLRKIGFLIAKANETRNRHSRCECLHEALSLLVDCFLTTRTVLDLQYITKTRWSDFTLNAEDLRRQLYGWYEYTLNEIRQQDSGNAQLPDNDLDLFYDIPELPSRKMARIAGESAQG